MNKDQIIEKVYYDPAGYGSISKTLKDSQEYDPTITYEDVRKWKDSNLEKKRQIRGMNSFIASKPFQEFEIYILFFADLKDSFAGGLLLVDIFTKYCQIVPIHGKTTDEILDAQIEGFKLMKGKPEVEYSDAEPAFSSTKIRQYVKGHNVKHIIT